MFALFAPRDYPKFVVPLGNCGDDVPRVLTAVEVFTSMHSQETRIQPHVAQLTKQLPASLASRDDIERHLRHLITDYGLSPETARQAAKIYFTESRDIQARRLASDLAGNTRNEAAPNRDQLAADLELLDKWHIPLNDAREIVFRAYSTDNARDPPAIQEATDQEVANAVPTLGDTDQLFDEPASGTPTSPSPDTPMSSSDSAAHSDRLTIYVQRVVDYVRTAVRRL